MLWYGDGRVNALKLGWANVGPYGIWCLLPQLKCFALGSGLFTCQTSLRGVLEPAKGEHCRNASQIFFPASGSMFLVGPENRKLHVCKSLPCPMR